MYHISSTDIQIEYWPRRMVACDIDITPFDKPKVTDDRRWLYGGEEV